jgi:hypothetical protein
MQKMVVSAACSGLWRDFTVIKWIFDYLQRPIYVWSNEFGSIIDKQGLEFELKLLYLAFGSNHF